MEPEVMIQPCLTGANRDDNRGRMDDGQVLWSVDDLDMDNFTPLSPSLFRAVSLFTLHGPDKWGSQKTILSSKCHN